MDSMLTTYGITADQACILALAFVLGLWVFRNLLGFLVVLAVFAAIIWVIAKIFLILAIAVFAICLFTFIAVMSSDRRRSGG